MASVGLGDDPFVAVLDVAHRCYGVGLGFVLSEHQKGAEKIDQCTLV